MIFFRLNVVLLFDNKSRDERGYSAEHAEHDERNAQSPYLLDAVFHQYALYHRCAEHHRRRDNIEQADYRIEEHSLARLGDDLRLKRAVGNVIERREQVIEREHHADPYGVYDA